MPSLPVVHGREAVRAFENAGFSVVRVRGSHHIMKKPAHPVLLSVPVHGNRPIAPGTLRNLITDAGLTIEQFVDLVD